MEYKVLAGSKLKYKSLIARAVELDDIEYIRKCRWEDLVYIGDNPLKDFVSLKKVNAKTIRLKKGNYSDTIVSDEYEAQSRIHSLDELSSKIKKLFN